MAAWELARFYMYKEIIPTSRRSLACGSEGASPDRMGNGFGQRRFLVEHEDLRRPVGREGFAKRTPDALGAPRYDDKSTFWLMSVPRASCCRA